MKKARARDWAWPWTRAWGPLTLSLHLDVTVEALEALLGRLNPNPYTLESEGRYHRGGAERAELLLSGPGLLQLVRSFHEPPPSVRSFDARLLAALARGVLGPLKWDLVDEEYVEPLGGGDDAASLARHLSIAEDETTLRAEYARRFTPFTCDASHARSADEVLDVLSVALGAPAALRGEAFAHWFAETPGLPMRLSITVNSAMREEWQQRVLARPGTVLSVRAKPGT